MFREQDSAAALRQLRSRLGEDRARLVEATEHRQRPARYSTRKWSRPARCSFSSSHASSSDTGVVPKKRQPARDAQDSGGTWPACRAWAAARSYASSAASICARMVRHLRKRRCRRCTAPCRRRRPRTRATPARRARPALSRSPPSGSSAEADDAPLGSCPQSSATRSPAAAARSASGICAPERVVAPARPVQGFPELGLEGEVELGRRDERGGALEQADGGAVVLAGRRARSPARPSVVAAPRRPGCRRRAARARRGSGRPARGGSRGSRPARPVRRRAPLARLRSAGGGLRGSLSAARRRRRRGSAGGGSGRRPRRRAAAVSGLISSLRTSAASRGVTWVSSGASACTAPRWKTSPSTAPRSSTLRSAVSS